MSARAGCGIVSISIDAENDAPVKGNAEAVESLVVDLLDRFDRHRVAATWAFGDPATNSLAKRRIHCDMPQQEIALSATKIACDAETAPAEFVRKVIQRLQGAAVAGIQISTLVVNGPWRPQRVDLLAKHGIRMVRSESIADSAAGVGRHGISRLDGNGAQAVCHGLWHVPATATLGGAGGWLANWLQSARLLRGIKQAASRGGCCHVRIDAASLASGDAPQKLATIERLLRQLDRLRQQGRIRTETLRATAERLLPKRSAAAHSILRAA